MGSLEDKKAYFKAKADALKPKKKTTKKATKK